MEGSAATTGLRNAPIVQTVDIEVAFVLVGYDGYGLVISTGLIPKISLKALLQYQSTSTTSMERRLEVN